jgi:predicted ATP-grasp superfamily ATP-dependent carboligase
MEVEPMMAGVDLEKTQSAPAVVMNLFYTGLGIARSLGERAIPVIGLTAERGMYGNFSRYAKTILCADSHKEPEVLLRQLLELGQKFERRAVLFPTRDHDLVFLNRFRRELDPYFVSVLPSETALERCLDKWETHNWASRAGVPAPGCWLVESAETLQAAASRVTYPCVLKPVAAYRWRTEKRWELVGARKAIRVTSREELLAEYAVIAAADRAVLVQEEIPGDDDCLVVAACYIDRHSRFQGGFNAQKLVQDPPGFGTGCIVQAVDRPELFDRTIGLLQALEFTGIAEVEYKWDARDNGYKLIEVNPRPWDQHRLGTACGVDLMYLAYCDLAGLPMPAVHNRFSPRKWIAEDAFLLMALRLLWRRETGLARLFRSARGAKMYAIWSASDPLPFLAYVARLVPTLIRMGFRSLLERLSLLTEARGKPAMRVIR